MRSRVTKYALAGVGIAVIALIMATLLVTYFQFGSISLGNIVEAQRTNITLWFLDAMPFIFAFWGQYTSMMMAYEAGTMVIDQTEELRNLTAVLEQKAAHDATHDAVTDLPNRILMLDRLEQAVQSGLRRKERLSLMIVDIERFKEINETLGHFSGDRLLKQVVSRLQGMVRKSDTLARVGPDEFAFLLNMDTDEENLRILVDKIHKIFLEPFFIEGLSLEVQASIGVTIFPDHGKDVDTIMQRTMVALYAAKQSQDRFAIYNAAMDKHSPQRLTMVGELRQAIENDELILNYQPKIDLKAGRIIGVEALVRWEHPDHGFMPPDEFIPMAERTGLIKPLSIWVLAEALEQVEEWHKYNLKLEVAVNISPTTLLDPEFPNKIIGMMSQYNIPANYVTLEVTEGSMIRDPDLAMEILRRLSEIGVKISIDDFGTGFSSLAYLKKLPVSEVKIDKSFVFEMTKNENDAVIVKSIIDLGHNLSMKVVAEGVEDKDTVLALKKLGCDVLQGFYFSRPMPPRDFLAWVEKSRKKKSARKSSQSA